MSFKRAKSGSPDDLHKMRSNIANQHQPQGLMDITQNGDEAVLSLEQLFVNLVDEYIPIEYYRDDKRRP